MSVDSPQANYGVEGRDSAKLTVSEALSLRLLKSAVVLAGQEGLRRPIEHVNMMTTPEILRWAKPHELMLTTAYPLPRSAGGLADLIRSFAERGVAGFGIKFGSRLTKLPDAALRAAGESQLPVIRIPDEIAFDEILSAVLSEVVGRQTTTVARSQQLHDSFLEIVLGGGALADVMAKLRGLLPDASLVALDDSGQALTGAFDRTHRALLEECELLDGDGRVRIERLVSGSHHDERHGIAYAFKPLQAGSLGHGFLLAMRREVPFDQFAVAAIEQAAVVGALDSARQIATSAVARQFEANVLRDLVSRNQPSPADVRAWSSTFGWDFDRELAVMVASPQWAPVVPGRHASQLERQRQIIQWVSAVRAVDWYAAVGSFTDELVAVVGAEGGAATVPTIVWSRLKQTAQRELSLGVSRTIHSASEIPGAYKQAQQALRIGRQIAGAARVTLFDDLGLFRLLSLIGDHDELGAFVTDTLGSVLALEPGERDELLHSLQVLLDVHLNVAKAARMQHFHYNTMRYRINKLENLLGPFTRDNRQCVQLSVALQALTILDR